MGAVDRLGRRMEDMSEASGRRSDPDPLRRAAGERPDDTAASGPGGAWDYRRLDAEADGVAAALRRHGVDRGDRVAVHLPRGLRAVAAIHGVPRSGAAMSVLHPEWTRQERTGFLELLDPSAAVCGPESSREVAAALPRLPRVVLERRGAEPGIVRSRPGAGPKGRGELVTPDPEADHSLVATSGTAGGPRAVRLTLANHLASARGARERLELGPDDRWFAALSLAHVGGLAMVVRAAVVGCELVVRPEFDAEEAAGLVARGRLTHLSLVPVMLRRLMDALGGEPAAEALRCLLVGGAATPAELLDRALEAGLPVSLTYGLTEACSQVATAPPELVRRKPGSVGPPLPDVEVRLESEDDGGGDGEILVRGPTVAAGVLERGENGLAVDDGWLRTGDAGRMDEDGDLWITGRLSNRIVTGGVTVDPAEVERALRQHPAVAACAVVGVPDPDWGERVAAAVVPGPEGSDGPQPGPPPGSGEETPRAEELRQRLEDHCRRHLSGPRRPRSWSFLVELPRNPNGKVDRQALRRLMGPGSAR